MTFSGALADDTGDQFNIAINGRDWRHRPLGQSSGSGELGRTLELIPGYPGRKDIVVTVTHEGKTGRGLVSVDYAPAAAIEPAWVDGHLRLEPGALEVRLRYINDFKVTLNGVAAEFSYLKAIFADGMEQVVMLDAGLAPGRNELVMTGTDWRGQTVTLVSFLYFAPGGVVNTGDTFTVVYGEAGSRSGPFYSTAIPGEALENGRSWETPDGKLVREFRAVKPGRAVINIFKKAHFRGNYVLESTINLTVR